MMQIDRTVSVKITFTPAEVERACLDKLPKRFAGKEFMLTHQEDGGLVLDLVPEQK